MNLGPVALAWTPAAISASAKSAPTTTTTAGLTSMSSPAVPMCCSTTASTAPRCGMPAALGEIRYGSRVDPDGPMERFVGADCPQVGDVLALQPVYRRDLVRQDVAQGVDARGNRLPDTTIPNRGALSLTKSTFSAASFAAISTRAYWSVHRNASPSNR